MTLHRLSLAIAAVLLTGVLAPPACAEATAEQVVAARSVKDLLALGASKMSAADFTKKIVGKKMSGDGWTWIIAKDGTTSSASTDGSWKEDKAPWNMKGDQYCAPLQGAVKCRDVYILGKFMRMSDKGNPKKLSPWTVTLK